MSTLTEERNARDQVLSIEEGYMSIDRCSRCGDLVDTDAEPEAYVDVGNMRGLEAWICLCRRHREEYEDGPPEREFSPEQQAIIDAAEAGADPDEEAP